jgi:NADH:ubiquinone oxidoreductase, NDUFB6/B17 subunit
MIKSTSIVALELYKQIINNLVLFVSIGTIRIIVAFCLRLIVVVACFQSILLIMTGHSSWEEQRYLYPHDYRDKFPVWEREFNIEPFKFERSRLPFRMTNEERLWRKQWLQDQVLATDEPKNVPNLDKLHKNPIRYNWMVFWDNVFNRFRPILVCYHYCTTFN